MRQKQIYHQGKLFMGVALLALFAGVVSYFALENASERAQASSSIELGFSSLSPSGALGGEILPASCESNYNHDTGGGFTSLNTSAPAVANGGRYRADSWPSYCLGNNGGPTYFAPMNTWAEFSGFWNSISRLSGLYTIP